MGLMHRLEVFHQSCLRRILKIRFYHHVTNVSVLKQTRCNTIEQHIATMRLVFKQFFLAIVFICYSCVFFLNSFLNC